jgi:outer membrane cobalamin receptor
MLRPTSGYCRRVLVFTAILVLALAGRAAAGPGPDTLRGRVLDPDKRPIARAEVIILNASGVVMTVQTSADGTFGPIALRDGEYDLVVAAPGFGLEPQHISIKGAAPVEVDLLMKLSAVSESVVVSAAQVDQPLMRVTDSVTVIDRVDLDGRQIDTVVDALRVVPGFNVASNGGRGAVTSIFPRGGESDYTLVLVDGIPQNAFGGSFDAGHLSTADVDRIEVVRGPQSALYGSGAIGGVVQVITRQGGARRASFSLERGGSGTTRATGGASGSMGLWRFGGAIDWLKTDGDRRVFPSIGRAVANDDYERTNTSGSIGWGDKVWKSVRADFRVDRNERGYPGAYGSNPIGAYSGLDLVSRGRNTIREAGVSAIVNTGTHVQHRLNVNAADFSGSFVSPFGPSTSGTRRISGRYQVDYAGAGPFGFTSGSEVVQERARSTYVTGQTFQPVPVTRLLSSWFAEARGTIAGRAFLTAGLRLERILRHPLEASPGTRPALAQEGIWSLNPKLSGAWFVRAPGVQGWTKLRFSAATGIKPPDVFEIAFSDNPNLKPERSRSVDVGIEQALVRSTLVLDATWFANRYNQLIVAVGSSLKNLSQFQTDNIANARSRGVELGLIWRANRAVSARASWTWLDTQVLGLDHLPDTAPPPFKVGDPLVRRPRNQGMAEVTWTGARAGAFVVVNGRGRMRDIEPNYGAIYGGLFTNPSYATVTVGGSTKIGRSVEVFGRATNLFDRLYEDTYGFPALGRSVTVGVRVTSGR